MTSTTTENPQVKLTMARETPPKHSERTSEILSVFNNTFGSLLTGDPAAFQSKFRKMAATPFAFFRGSACLFYHDLREEAQQGTYLDERTSRIWIHGDLHAENFGTYMNSHGRLIFNVNDFDESYIGPFTWDLKRFCASIALIGYGKALSDEQIAALVKVFATSYRRKIREMASRSEQNSEEISGFSLHNARGPLLECLRSARLQSRVATLDATTHIHGHERHFSKQDGVIEIDAAIREKVTAAFEQYLSTLPKPRKQGSCYIKDVVSRRGVGIGSAGLPTYNILVAGDNEALEGDVIIYMKQSQPSAVSSQVQDFKAQSYFKHEGHRTVTLQRSLQAHADPWLGWTEMDGKGYMVTEVSPFANDIEWSDINDPEEIMAVVADLGQAVAIMHKAADKEGAESLVPFPIDKAINEAIGSDETKFESFLTEFAFQYSDRVREDHRLFVDAFRNGRIPGL
jgi:uncharacterized protein (DUF2252 family)